MVLRIILSMATANQIKLFNRISGYISKGNSKSVEIVINICGNHNALFPNYIDAFISCITRGKYKLANLFLKTGMPVTLMLNHLLKISIDKYYENDEDVNVNNENHDDIYQEIYSYFNTYDGLNVNFVILLLNNGADPKNMFINDCGKRISFYHMYKYLYYYYKNKNEYNDKLKFCYDYINIKINY
jgi:hypothetical protein